MNTRPALTLSSMALVFSVLALATAHRANYQAKDLKARVDAIEQVNAKTDLCAAMTEELRRLDAKLAAERSRGTSPLSDDLSADTEFVLERRVISDDPTTNTTGASRMTSTATIKTLPPHDIWGDFVESQIQIGLPHPRTPQEFDEFCSKCHEVCGNDNAIIVSINGIERDVVARNAGVRIGEFDRYIMGGYWFQ